MKILTETSAVLAYLISRSGIKRGRIWDALRPLLGEGLITAEGRHHQIQRAQLGNALSRIEDKTIEEAVQSFPLPTGPGRIDLNRLAQDWVEQVMRRVLFGAPDGQVGDAIRAWLRLFPLRMLGLPVGQRYIDILDREVQSLTRPDWMPVEFATRDQIATLYVAAVETTASSCAAALAGHSEWNPIWFLPRQDRTGGTTLLATTAPELRYGAGHRKCLGKDLAEKVIGMIVKRFREELEVTPVLYDLRPTWGLTRRPRKLLAQVDRKILRGDLR